MGSNVGEKGQSSRLSRSPSTLEGKMVEAMRKRAQSGTKLKSFNNIIMKFYSVERSLNECKSVFEQFDEDSNGLIDAEELKRCLQKLEVNLTEEETNELLVSCEISNSEGMKFYEFIVLLCLVYLLQRPSPEQTKSVIGLSELESAFETLVDSFVYLDKNKDGYVSKKELIDAMSDTDFAKEKGRKLEPSAGQLAIERFEEMDSDKNGMVSFKEFLFACIRWADIDYEDDEANNAEGDGDGEGEGHGNE